jgi:hypothetical protein
VVSFIDDLEFEIKVESDVIMKNVIEESFFTESQVFVSHDDGDFLGFIAVDVEWSVQTEGIGVDFNNDIFLYRFKYNRSLLLHLTVVLKF